MLRKVGLPSGNSRCCYRKHWLVFSWICNCSHLALAFLAEEICTLEDVGAIGLFIQDTDICKQRIKLLSWARSSTPWSQHKRMWVLILGGAQLIGKHQLPLLSLQLPHVLTCFSRRFTLCISFLEITEQISRNWVVQRKRNMLFHILHSTSLPVLGDYQQFLV